MNRSANRAPDARLDNSARGFRERQRTAFFDVRVCHPNADSYRDQSPKEIYRQHENEKRHKYASRVMEVEQGTFTPLVFSTTGAMADECKRYHNRLAELLPPLRRERTTPAPCLGQERRYPLLSSARLSSAALEVPEEEEEMYPFRTQTLKSRMRRLEFLRFFSFLDFRNFSFFF